MLMATVGLVGVFADEVYSSTDLNRRHTQVLNQARKGPVTISRNNEQFALMKRSWAASLFKAVRSIGETLELIQVTVAAMEGKEVPARFEWLQAFDKGDLMQMVDELIAVTKAAMDGSREWEDVAGLVHQWHESSLAAAGGVLDRALADDLDETPLTDPSSSLEPEPVG
jgi:hypothetical protein